MEERLRLGVSNRDLTQGMSKIPNLNYLGDYSHDNIDVGHIMKGLCKQPSSPAAVIINSGNEISKGEHWEAIYISPTDQTLHKSRDFLFLRTAFHTRWNLQAARPAQPERLGVQPSACTRHYGYDV